MTDYRVIIHFFPVLPGLGRTFVISLLSACMAIFLQCSSVIRPGRPVYKKAEVTITDTAPNDLGQVMIFTTNDDNEKIVFVKNFYKKYKSKNAISKEMKGYIRNVKRYKGKKVVVTYFEDDIGDLVLYKMK